MMASNILSRLLPAGAEAPSEHESARHDLPSDPEDVHDHDMSLDEENLDERFHDQDIEAMLADAAESHITSESTAFLPPPATAKKNTSRAESSRMPKWFRGSSSSRVGSMEEDDDVPQSLLLESGRTKQVERGRRRPGAPSDPERLPSPVPGPSTRTTKKQWETTRTQQRLYQDSQGQARAGNYIRTLGNGRFITDPKEREMWRWAQVNNLDRFLQSVYAYHSGKGIWSILLQRVLSLISTAFLIGFLTFLCFCIDYQKIPQSSKLEDITISQCTKKMSGWWNLVIWLCTVFWLWNLFTLAVDIPRLWHMHNFFRYLLDIPDSEIQTVSWQIVVRRLMTLREKNPITADMPSSGRKFLQVKAKQRMDAHDIANRLMRRENYLIALFNKDILDLSIHIPFFGPRPFVSQTMLWAIDFCIMDFAFTEDGLVNPNLLNSKARIELVERLKRRIKFAAVMNIFIVPFMSIYFIATNFFTYFSEYRANPAQFGSRAFPPLAQWKFREFNELPHTFHRRMSMSYPFANRYLDQFPKDKMNQLSTFVAFVAGAITAVLGVATVLDSELFLGFEITPGRTVIFYLGVFGAIYQAARNASPEEHFVFDPEYALQQVIYYTRYYPSSWENRLHSDEVRREFSSLYQLKLIIGLEEFLSILLIPYILFVSLPRSVERIIDFFREFSVQVDGVGYVCSFAVFDFQKSQTDNLARRKLGDLREDFKNDKNDKKMYSIYAFLDEYNDGTLHNAKYNRGTSTSRFLPPPTFPGLASPSLGAEPAPVSSSRYGIPVNARQSTYRTPRFGPERGGHGSPMHSMLLDPHHQPRPLRPGQHNPDAVEEEDEENQLQERSSGNLVEEDSELGDSWRTTRPVGDEEVREEQTRVGDSGGVLGLLAQFSKATAEGRAASGL